VSIEKTEEKTGTEEPEPEPKEPTELEKLQSKVKILEEDRESLLDLCIKLIGAGDDMGFGIMSVSRQGLRLLKSRKMVE
jgi:hypothetical protein